MSTVMWVAIPQRLISGAGGAAPTEASIRVLVVPQLTSVDIVDAGLEDWPSTLRDEIVPQLRLRVKGSTDLFELRGYNDRARSDVWAGFFTATTEVIPYPVGGHPNPPPMVTPSFSQAAVIADSYRRTTRATTDPNSDPHQVIRKELLDHWNQPDPNAIPTSQLPPPCPATDFHTTVAMLREHPTVLIDLGLAFDVTVAIDDLAAGGDDPQLAIEYIGSPSWASVSPWTRYELGTTAIAANRGFWPAPASPDSGISRGMLNLTGSPSIERLYRAPAARWAISTFDVDGAIGNLRKTARDIAADELAEPAMPQLRSIGLALLRKDRQVDFSARVGAAATRSRARMAEAVLGAEDLVLGYRLDVRRENGAWRSVCWRRAAYSVGDVPIGDGRDGDGYVLEEGHIKPFSAVRDANGGLYSDDVVLRWNGWSLAVPTINLRGDTEGPGAGGRCPLPYQFAMTFKTPRRSAQDPDPDELLLPPLRFGDGYQIRVRIEDLAGGGVRFDDLAPLDRARASDGTVYFRHDPVQPPPLAGSTPFSPGAAVDRLVIRSDTTSPGPQSGDPSDAILSATETRTLAPPTASLQIVEQHRMLDGRTDRDAFELALRAMRADTEQAGLADPVAQGVNATIVDISGQPANRSETDAWAFEQWPNLGSKRIELEPGSDPQVPITMQWTGTTVRTLKITLSPAQQATIELSTTLRGDNAGDLAIADHFATRPGEQTLPTDYVKHTRDGRNPVVTPPRRIHVVHAVKRPLAQPLWTVPAAAVRGHRDTSIILKPTFTRTSDGQGLNPESTSRLAVAASWTEFEDIGRHATTGERIVTVDQVHSQTLPLGARPPQAGNQQIPVADICHEFGDTKHRQVTYTLTATSRFREYFPADDKEPEFQHTLVQPEVITVRSSVRPPPPVVLTTTPAFVWHRTQPDPNRIEHARLSRRIRIEVARPWFVTGAGETLAVVLAPAAGLFTADHLVTAIGRDPLFGSPATPLRPTKGWFPQATNAADVFLTEADAPVTAVPLAPTPAHDRWYVDVEFAGPTNRFYNPLVRLAVARYQPHSVEQPRGLSISPVVITDTAPLLPDRYVTVSKAAGKINITVTGASPEPRNQLEVIVERGPSGAAPETLDLTVEDASGIDPQMPVWRPIGRPLQRESDGSIPPVQLPPNDPGPFRLRIREFEHRLGDATSAHPADLALPRDLLRRYVFVDTIVLPSTWAQT